MALVSAMEELTESVLSSSPGNVSTASSRRSSLESCDSVRLESGIYLIRNRHDSEDSFEDSGDMTPTASGMTLEVPGNRYTSLPNDEAGSSDFKPEVLLVPGTSLTSVNTTMDRQDVSVPDVSIEGHRSDPLATDIMKDESLLVCDHHDSHLSTTDAWVTNTAAIAQDAAFHGESSILAEDSDPLVKAYSSSSTKETNSRADELSPDAETMQQTSHEPLHNAPKYDSNSTSHSADDSIHSTSNERMVSFDSGLDDSNTTHSGEQLTQRSIELSTFSTKREQKMSDDASFDDISLDTVIPSTINDNQSVLSDIKSNDDTLAQRSANDESKGAIEMISLDLESSQSKSQQDQGIMDTTSVDSLTLGEDPVMLQPVLPLSQDTYAASCTGPGTTLSPEVVDGDIDAKMANLGQNLPEFEMIAEEEQFHLESSIEMDAVSQDSISLSDISSSTSSSQIKESVPYSQSSNVPIPTQSSTSSVASYSPSALLPQDASPVRKGPPLRRTMSVPTTTTLTGMDPENFQRRFSSESPAGSKEKKKKRKKRKSQIVQIGRFIYVLYTLIIKQAVSDAS